MITDAPVRPDSPDEPGLALGDPTRPIRAALRGVTSIVAPTSVVTAVLFYFGWVRTSVQAADMGLHDSLLGYSTRDYILNSLDAMLWPLVVAVVTALAALALHFRLVGWAAEGLPRRSRGAIRSLTWAASTVGALCVLLGTVGAGRTDPSRLVFLASPLLLTAGIVVVVYSSYVRRLLVRRMSPPSADLDPLRLVASSLVVVLLLLSLFFSVQRYAWIKGGDRAVEFVQALRWQPDVTLYSAARLHLEAPVRETDLGDDGSAYRFRYTGLKLLFRADGAYFLRPSDESTPVNIVISKSDRIRFEFAGGLG